MFEILHIIWTAFYPILLVLLVAYGGVILLLVKWNTESPPETVDKDRTIQELKRSNSHKLTAVNNLAKELWREKNR